MIKLQRINQIQSRLSNYTLCESGVNPSASYKSISYSTLKNFKRFHSGFPIQKVKMCIKKLDGNPATGRNCLDLEIQMQFYRLISKHDTHNFLKQTAVLGLRGHLLPSS